MIERFVAALADMREADTKLGAGTKSEDPRPDWADAVRLQIDCMQQELDGRQRAALHSLLEALEAEPPDLVAIRERAGRASGLLRLSN